MEVVIVGMWIAFFGYLAHRRQVRRAAATTELLETERWIPGLDGHTMLWRPWMPEVQAHTSPEARHTGNVAGNVAQRCGADRLRGDDRDDHSHRRAGGLTRKPQAPSPQLVGLL
jgi:hypothetical protein